MVLKLGQNINFRPFLGFSAFLVATKLSGRDSLLGRDTGRDILLGRDSLLGRDTGRDILLGRDTGRDILPVATYFPGRDILPDSNLFFFSNLSGP